jgi:hypothetical protein
MAKNYKYVVFQLFSSEGNNGYYFFHIVDCEDSGKIYNSTYSKTLDGAS